MPSIAAHGDLHARSIPLIVTSAARR